MTTQGHIVGPLESPRKRQTCIGLKQFQTIWKANKKNIENHYKNIGNHKKPRTTPEKFENIENILKSKWTR